MPDIRIPSVGGIGTSMKSYGWGVVSGVIYNAVGSIVGSGLVAGAVTAGVTGAIVSGPTGQSIAAMAGFQAGLPGIQNLLSGGLGIGGLFAGIRGSGDDDDGDLDDAMGII